MIHAIVPRVPCGPSEPFADPSIGQTLPSRDAPARAPRGLVAGTHANWGGRVIEPANPQWLPPFVAQPVAPLWEKSSRGVEVLPAIRRPASAVAAESRCAAWVHAQGPGAAPPRRGEKPAVFLDHDLLAEQVDLAFPQRTAARLDALAIDRGPLLEPLREAQRMRPPRRAPRWRP
jgi:hypothetical protein